MRFRHRIAIAVATALALVGLAAASAGAVTQNWPDTYVDAGGVRADAFNGFLATHPGQYVYVCVTAKAVGGVMFVRVQTPYAGKDLRYFYTGGFSTVCENMYNASPGWGPVSIYGYSVGGSAVRLRQISIN